MPPDKEHKPPSKQSASGGKKAKRRAVVRLSEVDQRRLESGEITDPYEAVGKPDPLSFLDKDDDQDGSAEGGRDGWLKQNVPPHW